MEENTLNLLVAGVSAFPRGWRLPWSLFLRSPEGIVMHENLTFKPVFEIREKYLNIYSFVRDVFIRLLILGHPTLAFKLPK